MPDTTLLDRPATSTGAPEELNHIVCCDDDTALCGLDVSGDRWVRGGKIPVCPLCKLAWDEGPPCPPADCARRRSPA